MILFHEKDCIVQIPFGKRALCTKMATDETADKDRRAYKVPIPGNKSVVVTYGYPLLLGVTQMADGYNFAVEAEEDSEVYLLLYRKRGREPFYELLLDEKYRTGRIFSVFMKKLNVTNLEYNFKINGEIYLDPCASRISGRERFGAAWEEDPHKVRCGFWSGNGYDWGDEKAPETDFGDMILYKVHVRGYTRQAKLPAGLRGTFSGLVQMIPYWQELGINTVELMPAYEFMEVVPPKEPDGLVSQKGKKDEVNYWGYGNGLYFAPKSAYCATRDPHREFCDMIRAFHKAGIGCIMEMYFPAEVNPLMALRAVQFWKQNYHVDGFHILGEGAPLNLIMKDGLLAGTKIMAEGMDTAALYKKRRPGKRCFAEYNLGFLQDMRRFLKSDEDMVPAVQYRIRYNPDDHGVINYITCQDGFTLNDLVSYNYKHNEANGEGNNDGCSYNYSWNCGIEGPSRKQWIRQMRERQMRAAFAMMLFSQGVPMIYGGDEIGNSQEGNNNAYCQDNSIGWIDWRGLRRNASMLAFVKKAVALRKAHPVLHMSESMKEADYLGKGFPDMSFHGERAWFCNMENTSRMIGVMLCGAYAKLPDGSEDDFLYTGYNFHWETRNIALPNLPEGMEWKKVMDTGDLTCDGFYGENGQVYERAVEVGPRTVVVLQGVKKPEPERKHTGKGKKNEKLPGAEAKKTAASDNTVTEAENKERRSGDNASMASL